MIKLIELRSVKQMTLRFMRLSLLTQRFRGLLPRRRTPRSRRWQRRLLIQVYPWWETALRPRVLRCLAELGVTQTLARSPGLIQTQPLLLG